MSKMLTRFLVVALSVLMFAGCRSAPVHNVQDATIVSATGKQVTMEQFKQAVVRAGAALGWSMKSVSDGHIVGTLYLRDHMAQVDINYTTSAYSINYKDSSNLKYNAEDNSIHSNYNGWVQNLQRNIQAQMSLL